MHPDVTPDVCPDVCPDTTPDMHSDTYPDMYPDTHTDTYPDTCPGMTPDMTPVVCPDTTPDMHSDTYPDMYPDTCPDTYPDTNSGTNLDNIHNVIKPCSSTTGMNKLLQKTLRDEIKEDRCVLGARQVLQSLNDSKLLVISRSVPDRYMLKITEAAKSNSVPTIKFDGTSVALGRLCGRQFRISTISFNSLTDDGVASLINESE